MKLALCLSVVAPLLAQRAGPQILFPYPLDDNGASIFNINAAATWRAVGFTATAGRTLSTVEIYFSSITGSMASGEIRAGLYSDSTGKPGTEIEGRTIGATPAAGWNTFSGFTSTVTQGTSYWIVFTNTNSTPASNYPVLRLQSVNPSGLGTLNVASSSVMGAGWISAMSTDSGTNWTRGNALWNAVLTWSDGTKEGVPIDSAGTQCQIYSARECGTFILTPPYALNVDGVAMTVSKTGTPTGVFRIRVYEGAATSLPALVGQTGNIPVAGISSTSGYISALFSSPLLLKANTRYRVVASEATNSDTSSNRFNVLTYRLLSTAASIFMPMLGAVPSSTLSTDGGGTFTDTANEFALFTFIMDPARPFLFTGGGTAITQ